MNETDSTPIIEQKPIWQNLIGIIDKPRETFQNLMINLGWSWVIPFILTILVTIATVWVMAPYTSEMTIKSTQQQLIQSGMSPDEIEKAMSQTNQLMSPTFFRIIGSVVGPITVLIGWLIGGAILYFMGLIAGGEFNFKAVFTVFAWSNLPLMLRTLVQTILTGITGKFPLYTGLAALVITGNTLEDTTNPLVALLSFADIFWIWHIILLVIGLSVAGKVSRGSAFFITAVYILVSVSFTVGQTLLATLY